MPTPMHPHPPIIFVHGWGGVADLVRDFDDRDERDPYCGWNRGHRYNDPDGWNRFRTSQPNFEGLVLRLVKEYGYFDACNDEDLVARRAAVGADPATLARSVWVFRYYEYNADHLALPPAAEQVIAAELRARGAKVTHGIPRYAALLALKIRRLADTSGPSPTAPGGTEPGLGLGPVALVGHSMGGLISRFALQYNLFDAARHVARLMTLATPHAGARYGKPSGWLRYLPGFSDDDLLQLLPEWVEEHLDGREPASLGALGADDVFCLVGTRHDGYGGAGRLLPRSDGIVHQDDAFLLGRPYAYVHNTHSGEHGIRENHDAFQSMRRFLFGDLRVSIRLRSLKVGGKFPAGSRFYFEISVRPRGVPAYLNELSERGENSPRPRTAAQITADLPRFVLYDGFADSSAIVAVPDRRGWRIDTAVADLPTLEVHWHTYLASPLLGGQPVGSGTEMVPLRSGVLTWKDKAFTAEVEVTVRQRS